MFRNPHIHFSSVSRLDLAAFGFLARGTNPDNVDRVAFHLKAPGQLSPRGEDSEILLIDVRDGLAMRAHHVMVNVVVELHAEGAVVHADFPQHACFNEKMDVFVNRRQGDCRYALFDPRVNLFRARMARHRLHDLI